MARNFYKRDGSYYYSDNNQKIYDIPELQAAARAGGQEVAYSESLPVTTQTSQEARDFYKKNGSYYYADNNQKIYDIPELQAAARAGGKEVSFEESLPKTQAEVDNLYKNAVAENPVISELTQGGSSLEEIINALSTGNLSGIVDFNGQPFSAEAQQEALAKGMEDNKLYYEALQNKEKADAEASLAQQKSDYQNYLLSSGQSFEADKSKLDQTAANQGVLFSGGRVQKEKNMARAYEQDQDYTRNKVARNIGNTSRDYQYKYGNDAANSLNSYYNLGGNTFNPNKARNNVGSSGLSQVYNPSDYSYQGTRNTERSANANTRAAGYLWNKGNKLLKTGYNNKY